MTEEKGVTIEDILRERHMNIEDLARSSDSAVREILVFISPVEIAKLCRTSRKFNRICKDESFWKMKVKRSYGIEKQYKDTWRKTAEFLHKVNMINLSNKWINGSTYAEIIKDIQNQPIIRGSRTDGRINYLRELQYNSIRDFESLQEESKFSSISKGKYGFIKREPMGMRSSLSSQIHSIGLIRHSGKIFDASMHHELVDRLGRDLTNIEIETLEDVFTAEFAIIYRSFFEIDNTTVLPFGRPLYFANIGIYNGNLKGILLPLVDVYPYIMYFSSFEDHQLNEINDHE